MSVEAAGEMTLRQMLTFLADLELSGGGSKSITLELGEKLGDELLDSKLSATGLDVRRHLFIGAAFIFARCLNFSGMARIS